MKKIGLAALVVLLGITCGYGQVQNDSGINIVIAEPHKNVDALGGWMRTNDKYIVSLKTEDDKSFVVQSFLKSTVAENGRFKLSEDFVKKGKLEGFEVVAGKFWIFCSVYLKESDNTVLNAYQINPETAEVSLDPILLMTISGNAGVDPVDARRWLKRPLSHEKTINRERFTFRTSAKNLLIYCNIQGDNYDVNSVGMALYDEGLNNIWNKGEDWAQSDFSVRVRDFLLTDSGKAIFMVGEIDSFRNMNGLTRYFMITIGIDGLSRVSLLDMKTSTSISQVQLLLTSEDQVYVCALSQGYSAISRENVFLVKYDLAIGQVMAQSSFNVEEYFNFYSSEYFSSREGQNKRRLERWNPFTVLNEMVFDAEGNVLLLMEEVSASVNSVNLSDGMSSTVHHNYFSDALIAKLDQNCKVDWIVNVPKMQHGTEYANPKEDMSYTYLLDEESLHILYLDNFGNLNLKDDQVPLIHEGSRRGFMTDSRVNLESGRIQKSHLFDVSDCKGFILYNMNATRFVSLSNSAIAFEAYKKKSEDVWIQIKLK